MIQKNACSQKIDVIIIIVSKPKTHYVGDQN